MKKKLLDFSNNYYANIKYILISQSKNGEILNISPFLLNL